MKKIVAFLLLGFTVAFASCGDEKTDNDAKWFLTPEAAVSGTTVRLTCLTRFGDGVLESTPAGFAYTPVVDGSLGAFTDAAATVGGSTLSCTLTGLSPRTAYVVYAYADLSTGRVQSRAAAFETGEGSGVTPGRTRYSGWAELLSEEERPDDYYYAYHYCDGAPGGRNYSVCYSKEMRGAVWVAYPMHTSYTEGSAGGQNQSWKYDPVIPRFVQPNLSSSYKASGDGSFSRGHMLASNDRQSDKPTNKQTFYYTNMSPQIQNGFNSGIWSSLEGNCHEMICSDTLYMVTGAYFGNQDTHCKDNDGNTVTVPTHYYKVLIRSKSGNTGKPIWTLPADQIECAGYWIEHKSYTGSGARPVQFIKPVSWIEQQTGKTFFPNVPNAPKENLDTSFWKI